MNKNNFKNSNNKAILLIGIVIAIVLSFVLTILTTPKSKSSDDLFRLNKSKPSKSEKPTVNESAFKTLINDLRKEADEPIKIIGLDLDFVNKNDGVDKKEENKEAQTEVKEEVDSNGNTLLKTYINGVAQGKVTIKYKNGETEIANYKDGVLEGETTYTFNNGDKEIANYKNGILDGKATYIFPNGEKIDYEYKNGKKIDYEYKNGKKIDQEHK